ncbi:MAG: hypothetical protein GY705_25540, partial [Bacteroidetes bacterium]|nr:hypothetical protein [Bacteroidota bacterium]
MTENLTNKEFNQKRHRFLLGILAITLLFITYVVYAGTALHRQALKISQNRLILLASQLEKHTKNYFSNYISLFESISELSTVRLKDTVALNAFFNRLNRRFTEFENIAAVDENGFFFASGRPFDLNNPPNVSKLPFFQDARRGDAVIIMEPHIG